MSEMTECMGDEVVGGEIKVKLARARKYMCERGLDVMILRRFDNFAWITAGGDNRCAGATDIGVASVLITHDDQWVLTSNVEARRLCEEALAHIWAEGIFRMREHPWYGEAETLSEAAKGFVDGTSLLSYGGRVGADVPLAGAEFVGPELVQLRYPFTKGEADRYVKVAHGVAEVVERAAREVRRGQTEREIAGRVASDLFAFGYFPTVLLVGADWRVERYRHPLPTMNLVDKYCMIIVCAHCGGLTVALTRSVHIGEPSPKLRRRHEAAADVCAAMNARTRAGTRWADVMEAMKEEYRAQGFEDEWKCHHQGGPIGYQDREFFAMPQEVGGPDRGVIMPLQAVAWNPSVPGAKSEDSFLVMEDETRVVTVGEGWWPMIEVKIDGVTLQRPDILVI